MLLSRKLMVATNSGDVYTASNKLKEQGIRCTVSTNKSGNQFSNYRASQDAARYGFSMNQVAPETSYSYVLTVWLWDYKKAKEILDI